MTEIGDPNRWGLDAAFPRRFAGPARSDDPNGPGPVAAVLAVAVALVTTPLVPVGVPILVAALVVVPVAMSVVPVTSRDGEPGER